MPTPSVSPSTELRKLNFTFTLEETPRTSALIRNLESKVKHVSSDGECIVHGSFLAKPEGKTDLWFQFAQSEEDKKAKCFYCHITFMRRTTDPPQLVVERCVEVGITTESFLEELSEATEDPAVRILVDAELRQSGRGIRSQVSKLTTNVPSLHAGSTTLEPCGVEYAAQIKADGVRGMRVSYRRASRWIWLNYSASWAWNIPWDLETNRCRHFSRPPPVTANDIDCLGPRWGLHQQAIRDPRHPRAHEFVSAIQMADNVLSERRDELRQERRAKSDPAPSADVQKTVLLHAVTAQLSVFPACLRPKFGPLLIVLEVWSDEKVVAQWPESRLYGEGACYADAIRDLANNLEEVERIGRDSKTHEFAGAALEQWRAITAMFKICDINEGW